MQNFLEVYWAIVPEYASSFHEKTYAFVSSYKTSKESSKRSIQLQTGKIFFMIFSINSFHSILSTSKKWRLRLTVIDVLIYYLLIWKPIEPIVGLIGSTYEKTAACFLRCSFNFGHVFFPSIILLLTSCINPSAATIHNITMLFLFFPLRGLSIFTRPNELLNAEVLYLNLFAVKKIKYDVYLPPAWESPFFCRWYLKAEIRNQKRTLLSLTSHRQIDYLSKFVDSLYLSCMSVTENW